MAATGKCSGQCCQRIVLPQFTFADLRIAYLAWINGAKEFTCPSGTFPMINDVFLLFTMLVQVGVNEAGREVFRCKHYDGAAGLCTIYDYRPTMCRRYPCGKCTAEGCTFSQ